MKGRLTVVLDPVLVLTTIRAGFDMGTELLRFLQTPQGKEFVEKSLADREEWDRFWSEAGGGLAKFFSGKLFSG